MEGSTATRMESWGLRQNPDNLQHIHGTGEATTQQEHGMKATELQQSSCLMFVCGPPPPLQLFTSPPLHLCTSAPLHLCTSAPLHLCTSAPLHLCTSPPPHLPISPPLLLSSSPPLPLSPSPVPQPHHLLTSLLL